MRAAILLAALPLLCGASAGADQRLEIRDAAVRLIVIPETRRDVVVQVASANRALPLRMRRAGGKLTISGSLARGIRGCPGDGRTAQVKIDGVGQVGLQELPQVIVRMPRDVRIAAGGAVFGSIGRAASVDLGNAGCGDWVIADVQTLLRLTEAGSGDMRAGSAGQAKLRIAGAGDISVGEVRGAADAEIGGSGDISIRSVNGPLVAKIAGSGDIHVGGGRARLFTASVAGPGGVYFSGVADALRAQVLGSGDIEVARVTGSISKSIVGAGRVRIGDAAAGPRP